MSRRSLADIVNRYSNISNEEIENDETGVAEPVETELEVADVVEPEVTEDVVEPATVEEPVVDPSEVQAAEVAEIEEATELTEQLDTLADYAADAPAEVAMEQYTWMFHNLLESKGYKAPKSLGIESVDGISKSVVVRGIREYTRSLRAHIRTAERAVAKKYGA